jgi:CBS domain containing-hemolysin-like protein
VDVTLWIELVVFVILMAFSGFFSSSETSLFSLDKLQIEQMRRNDNPRVELIERMLSEPRRLIVTILIGNEFVNVAASVISAAIVIDLLGADNKLINLFVMVPILLLVGEITPKTLAIRNSVAFATFQSRPIQNFATLITPIRWVVRLVADWFTTLVIGKERARGSIVTRDMVRTLAHEAVGDGVLDRSEAHYIDKIIDFGNKTLEDVMTPRSALLYLSADMTGREMVETLRQSRRTKVPVYEGDRDHVLGLLYARDLLGLDLANNSDWPQQLKTLLREPYFVPESKPVADLFRSFRRRRLSVALTVDEYGGVTGLVSMEDLLECIFGDIPSRSDQASATGYVKLDDGAHQVDASMPVTEFNRQFGTALGHEEVETLGGLLLNEYGELPPPGTRIVLGELEVTVETVAENRIQGVRVEQRPRPATSESGPPGELSEDPKEQNQDG